MASPTERATLLMAAPPALRLYIQAALYTSARLGNIYTIERDDIDLDAMTLHFPKTKNGDGHTIPLLPELVAALGPLPAEGRVMPQIGAGPNLVSLQFTRLCKRLGIKGLHYHDLRHTCATTLAEAGYNLAIIQAVTGHRDVRMLQRYMHPSLDVVRQAMRSLA